MNPWPFVTAAYAITLGSTGVLALLAYLAMGKAER